MGTNCGPPGVVGVGSEDAGDSDAGVSGWRDKGVLSMTKGGMTRLVICDPTLAFALPASLAASLAGPNDLARRRCRSVLVETSASDGT